MKSSSLRFTQEPAQAGFFALIRKTLLAGYKKDKRRLPWRGTRDPYRIWISEVMLQQTTVAAARNRYEGFLERFPDLTTLARARLPSVLAAWSGLGYYARARNLHSAAREVLSRHGGRLPRDPSELRRLPGFGDYTAAAVASLSFGARVPAADANVTRVLSRLFAIEGLSGSRAHRQAVLAFAQELLPRDRPGDLTAALMDLGQSLCTPSRPACPRCPANSLCKALRLGDPARYPRRPARPKTRSVWFAAAYVPRQGRALLARRAGGFLEGLWEFPACEGTSARQARRRLLEKSRMLGITLDSSSPIAASSHTVVNRHLRIQVFRGRPSRARAGSDGLRWFTPRDLARAAIPTLTRKIGVAAGFLRKASAPPLGSLPARDRASGRASRG